MLGTTLRMNTAQSLYRSLCFRTVRFIHDNDVSDFHQTCLERLDIIPHTGRLNQHNRMGNRGYLNLSLTRPHRLNDDHRITHSVQYTDHIACRKSHASEVSPRCRTSNENARVSDQIAHPQAITQQSASGKRAGGINSKNRQPDISAS
jgi:hypothetical protein